ncbi:DsbE family thiol:disulfide interchange protein [Sphingomonas sp. MG17]|uniref:DsbE family thiol:disulfide interchange protein n=1 Tax=Sphingomonas tagetis TaxID=2949092 RepID=A0A9X2HDD0_9SPHN|nr:DsbE family thiol:disulfide interchange protein [Sphingomonas tagetis]MCP3729046.1 DsbE family thiol:disulfide interchange protein [Sphingomonas tagetis]
MKRWLLWVPLLVFAVLMVIAGSRLLVPPQTVVKSALVGKPLPDFTLAPMVAGKPGVTRADFATGKPRLLNVFASWCVPCIAEAPHLMRLRQAGVEIDGIAIRDTPEAIGAFLARNGDPYARIGSDGQSQVQIGIGSSGVPETFVIDGRGRIAMQHIGDIREEDVPRLLQALEDAR